MKNLTLIILTFFISNVYAQQVVKTFGKFSEEEITMTSYEKDKEAKGVVLFDKGKTEFIFKHGERAISFRRHKRVKVFDKSVKGQAEVRIYYFKDKRTNSSEVKNITAITNNFVNGEQVMRKVEPTEIYDEQVANTTWCKKFVFPNVQDGSILEYKYVYETQRYFSLPEWIFQSNIPTLYSEYEAAIIPQYEYIFLAQGINKFDFENVSKADFNAIVGTDEQNEMEYILAKKDIPAFNDLSYITSKEDYIMKIKFQLARIATLDGNVTNIISTWPKLNKGLFKEEQFGYYMKGCRKYANEIGKLIKHENLSKQKKAKAVIEHVKQNFEWNYYNGKYANQSPKKFYDSKVGSVADINLFTIAVLNELDITAHPVILSTRRHGKIPADYPFDRFTNYVAILVEGDQLFLADATEDLLPYNRIPTRCMNGHGLIVNDAKEPQWISLANKVSSMEKNAITLTLNEETLDLDTKVSIQSTGYDSYDNRVAFKNDTAAIRKYYEKMVDNINAVRSINYNKNTATPYNVYMVGNYETERIADKIIVKPFLDLPIKENFLKYKTRNYPVDFVYPSNDEFISNLQVPTTHTIKKLPEEYSVSDDLVDLKISYNYENNALTAKGSCNYKKAVYSVEDYPKLREHIEMMVKYFNQSVVVEKAGS